MNEAEDQVLEHALRELLCEKTSDLPQRVLRAWRQSQETEGRRQTDAMKTPKPYLWLAAAAALLVALLLIKDSLRGGPEPNDRVAVATSEQVLGVLRAGDPETRMQSSFRVGETLVNGPLRERHLAFSSGESITLGRCSMLTFAHDESGLLIVPLVGQVTLRANGHSDLRVQTSLGTLSVEEAGKLRIELLADGYGLEHPERFQQLAKELHMKTSLTLILTLVTVLEGTVLLEATTGARHMVAGETLQDDGAEVPLKAIKSKLLEASGTWNLTVTEIGPNGQLERTFLGEQVCYPGPGDQWLISDMTLMSGPQAVTIHTVIGFNARKRSYTGTLFDNFGGEMGLLRGTVGADLDSRTLSMFSAESTPGFDVRWHMRWVSPDERRTKMEVLRDEEWVQVSETVHRRRE